MTATDTQLRAVVDGLQSLADEAFAVADTVEAAVRARLVDGATPTRETLVDVEAVAEAAVAASGSTVQGAGFVVAAGLLPETRWWLEWFVRDAQGRPARLEVHNDPLGMGFQDYEPLSWYSVPRATGSRHITGPYVDTLCTEDYTLTFTQPMTVDGTFLGVCGADITVRAAEQALLPVLRTIPSPVAVVNADGRVMVSNTGRLVCGELLRTSVPTPLEALHSLALPATPLRVVALDGR